MGGTPRERWARRHPCRRVGTEAGMPGIAQSTCRQRCRRSQESLRLATPMSNCAPVPPCSSFRWWGWNVSVSEQRFQGVPGCLFTGIGGRRGGPGPDRELEVVAEVAAILFQHGFRAALPALLGGGRREGDTIQAATEFGAAARARIRPPRRDGRGPDRSTGVTMSIHPGTMHPSPSPEKRVVRADSLGPDAVEAPLA